MKRKKLVLIKTLDKMGEIAKRTPLGYSMEKEALFNNTMFNIAGKAVTLHFQHNSWREETDGWNIQEWMIERELSIEKIRSTSYE